VFVPNYSSGNIETNRIQSVSACLAFFEAIGIFYKWFDIFCSVGPGNPGADRIGNITNFCSMIELLHELKHSSFYIEAFRH